LAGGDIVWKRGPRLVSCGGDFAGLLVPAKKGVSSAGVNCVPGPAVFWVFQGQVLMRGAACPVSV